MPNPDHRSTGSVPPAFTVFGRCPVIEGVSVILAIEMVEKLLVSAGERICRLWELCRTLICLCASWEKQNVPIESLSLAFAALLRVCERCRSTCQRKVHFVFTVY